MFDYFVDCLLTSDLSCQCSRLEVEDLDSIKWLLNRDWNSNGARIRTLMNGFQAFLDVVLTIQQTLALTLEMMILQK